MVMYGENGKLICSFTSFNVTSACYIYFRSDNDTAIKTFETYEKQLDDILEEEGIQILFYSKLILLHF